ncbi:hypothetical protein GQ53DRAFT_725461 [Thozetella sp. PMI_491]|nr:hypothetical protein GQ53DRAFT_725461 [Thozetella sp. PMI_491]
MATFTALNGASPKATESLNGSVEISRPGSASRPTADTDARPAGEVSTSQREREGWAAANQDRPPYPSASYPNVESSPQKRKRSDSASPTRGERQYGSASRSEDAYDSHRPHSSMHDQFGPAHRDYRPYGEESRESSDRWPPRSRDERDSGYDQPYSAAPTSAQPDEQMSPGSDERSMAYSQGHYTSEQRRDGLIQSDPKKRKRNFSNRTKTGCLTCRKRKKKCDEAKPECDNCIRGGFLCAGYPQQRGAWPKAEAKPPQITIESKDPNYVPPGAYGMPQQPAYGNQPASAGSQQPQSQQQPQPPQQQQQKREPLPYARGQPLRIDTPQTRPLQTDDDRATASTLATASSVISPENKLSGLSSSTTYTSGNVFPTPISAAPISVFSDRATKDYQRVPPLHDLTRTDPEQDQQPPPPPPPQQQQHLSESQGQPPQQPPQGQQATLPPPPPPPPPPTQGNTLPNINFLHRSTRTSSPPSMTSTSPAGTSAVQATAQLALSHTQFDRQQRRVEKDEMLIGRPYYPFDRELVLERQRCSVACWKFNNLTNPTTGVSVAERARLFRDILQPREGVQLSATQTSPVTHTGRVGENTTVETPFNCDYGYNIHIGSNVLISRNCLINDVCEVRIGNNVIISPNVCIYTGTCSTDPTRRGGNTGPQQGRPILIEDDVWIGANAIILDGVRIGKGSTIAAGCVVTSVRATPPFLPSVYTTDKAPLQANRLTCAPLGCSQECRLYWSSSPEAHWPRLIFFPAFAFGRCSSAFFYFMIPIRSSLSSLH